MSSASHSIDLSLEDVQDDLLDFSDEPDVALDFLIEDLDEAADDEEDDELEDDLEDDEVDDLISDVDADQAVEEDESFGDEGPGRRRMALRMRRKLQQGSTDSSCAFMDGHKSGYLQALRDHGVPARKAADVYGAMMPETKKVVRSSARAVGHALKGIVQGAAEVAEGQFNQFLATPVTDALPPTYVADEECFDDEGDELLEEECMGGLRTQDRYGSAAKYGFVGSHPRKAEREAAKKALERSGKKLSSPRRHGNKVPFVEDRESDPMLYSDGTIVDQIYGEMVAVPCPSCSGLGEDAARYGADTECVVCERFGVVLVPSGDVDDWFGSTTYGILPLLIMAGKGAWKLGKKHLFPAAKKAAQKWLQNSADAQAATADEASPEAGDIQGAVDEADLIGVSEGVEPDLTGSKSEAIRVLIPE